MPTAAPLDLVASIRGRRTLVTGGSVGIGRNCERRGHVGIGELDVLEIWLADALSDDARGLGVGKVARAEQLAHDDAFPVAGPERLRHYESRRTYSRRERSLDPISLSSFVSAAPALV